jgi:carboxyl-terminal processing protease
MRLKAKYTILISFLIFSCGKEETNKPLNTGVSQYIGNIIDPMKQNALHRNKIDWVSFKQKVISKAGNAQNVDEPQVIEAISLAITLLNDSHSYFVTHTGKKITGNHQICNPVNYTIPNLPSNIGYIKPQIFPDDPTKANEYAEALQNTIKNQDSQSLKGWVIDLRNVSGENMWPLIAGLGPFLGDGLCGYFIDYEGVTVPWSYANGLVEDVLVKQPYKLINNNNKIALLVNFTTSSAGEGAAISFIGKSNIKTFGEKTCGQATTNKLVPFIDGSVLHLTVSIMSDRNRKIYPTAILPEIIEKDQQKLIEKAVDWLNN